MATTFTKLKIGIPCAFHNSFFSTGVPQTTYAIASGFQGIGHDVFILRTTEKDWFDDCINVKPTIPIMSYIDFMEIAPDNQFDLIIDIDGNIMKDKKRPYAKKVVTFIRTIPFLSEMEKILFGNMTTLRDMEGVDAILLWSVYSEQDKQMYEVMYKKPVLTLPYNWFHKAPLIYSAEMRLPQWAETSKSDTSKEWRCHIIESNNTMSSSATIPMVIMGQIAKKEIIPVKVCVINNGNASEKSKFFQQNVHEHCKVDGLTYEFAGRQRIPDLVANPRTFVIAHNRFTTIKNSLLDVVWSGIPVIHNSPWLNTIGCGLERFYYEDNDILGACTAAKNMIADYEAGSGFFAEGALDKCKTEILKKLYYKEEILHSWGSILSQLISLPLYKPAPAPAPVAGDKNVQTLRVGFTDMWADFNPAYNFFTLLLESAFVKPIRIIGCDAGTGVADVIIFGPFGSSWKSDSFKGIPKIHYTGENTEPVKGDDVFLNLGYKHVDDADSGYVRLPLWMLEIDWFNADLEKIRNPKPLPLHTVMSVDPAVIDGKSKFCSFVVTNPRNTMRNNSFHWLSSYKHVDSAGRLFNNIGDAIFAGLGGGGGELKKHEFLKKYRFSLTYENEMSPGYTTEKILHAKAAGCVPIYWGDSLVGSDFDDAGFINANSITTKEELINVVKAIDENPEKWRVMAMTPALDAVKRDAVRGRMSHIARLILERLGFSKEIIESIPRYLGKESDDVIIAQKNTIDKPITYITYASHAVLKNLNMYISSLEEQKVDSATIFLAPDVETSTYETLQKKHAQFRFVKLETADVEIADFPDFWTPQHFAWKPYIIQRINSDESYNGKLCFYTDCGAVLLGQHVEYLKTAMDAGIAFLVDSRQKNGQWCHSEFCKALEVTQAELDQRQIWAGGFAFVAGSPLAKSVADESWTWAQKRAVITGPKWPTVENPVAHRHDQSIYSIVGLRAGAPMYPLDNVYNDHSYLEAQKQGASLYVHRGNFTYNRPVLPGISEVRLINLKRRPDRLEKFRTAHPDWNHRAIICDAVDGRALTLTPALASLFKPNDFMWKKAVMGCALSHLKIWKSIAENNTIENCLVLEDDVLFKPEFLAVMGKAAAHIPADYDILYLGGVLPPNRDVFEKVVEPVNEHWSRIKEHAFFGQKTPNRYFHFCNYSYVVRRSAAVKLLESIEKRGGYHTSADHMICNEIGMFKHYVINPTVAGCYQDDDPKYATSAFNDFNRVDGFDSDLWNNDERFTKGEIEKCAPCPVSIADALKSLDDRKSNSTTNIPQFYTIGKHTLTSTSMLEHGWLCHLMKNDLNIQHIEDPCHTPLDTCPIFIVQRPHVAMYESVFKNYDVHGKKFRVIHMSDEYRTDSVGWIELNACKSVIRTYVRDDLKGHPKVDVIPLGWAKKGNTSNTDRKYVWSFHGTRWANREAHLAPLSAIEPHSCTFYDNWMDPKQLGTIEYVDSMLNSVFVACPGGQNSETFRFYEALECGAIPLFIDSENEEWASAYNMIKLTSWEHARGVVKYFIKNKEVLEKYRTAILAKWTVVKDEASIKMAKFLA